MVPNIFNIEVNGALAMHVILCTNLNKVGIKLKIYLLIDDIERLRQNEGKDP